MLISKYGNGSTELVRDFEYRYYIALYGEYRDFLVGYNGGDTPNTRILSKGFSANLRCLFGILAKENIEDNLHIPVWEKSRYLPIGTDSFGNYYVIGTANDNGKVYFWEHEKGSTRMIADSFQEFIVKCKSEPINPRAKRTPEERESEMIAKGKAGNITDGLRELWKKEYEKYKDLVQEEVILP